ncbi:unnamed protein product [Strongylus vulgaris]|uniref:Sulfotransferase domain-containing protein n=1 Tax=Strongylus vulgaris TaxID=40348 RepID=A0A3P7L9U1_STRVU|nr:unnamed protein product [Strongylus vulgaris]
MQMAMIAFSYNGMIEDRISTSISSYSTIEDRTETHRLPSALIIGVRKGGTRALLDAMALHPKIRAVRKETHFFDLNFSKGIDWYRSLMPLSTPDQIVVEKTPGYFTSASTPKRIVVEKTPGYFTSASTPKRLRRVETFLNLSHSITNNQLIFNERKGFFCFLRTPTSRVRCLGNSKGRPHREISDKVIAKLRANLKEHNMRFFALVNRMFAW